MTTAAPSFTPPTQLFATDAYEAVGAILGATEPLVIVDGGAHIGRVTRRLLGAFPAATIYAFEPVRETFDQLASALADEPRATAVHAALGGAPDELEIRVNGCTGTSSILTAANRLHGYHGEKVTLRRTETVPVVTLDDWSDEQGVDRIDFLKLDLQGFELEALKGADRLLRTSVRAVYSEAQLVELYEDAALFGDLDRFLRDRGFDLYRIQEIFGGGPEQRSTCCDAIWIERDTLSDYCERIGAPA
ncbi:MAG: FkbM family methyltransferase [Phycisphaerales bacterium]